MTCWIRSWIRSNWLDTGVVLVWMMEWAWERMVSMMEWSWELLGLWM